MEAIMFRAVSRPITLSDLAQIYAWRLMLMATRLMHRITTRWAPVILPIVPLLWIPAVALLFGALLGWSIVR
jgi:hypothetical protein